MNKILKQSLLALLFTFTLSSCLFVNEELGSEFLTGTIEGETVVHLGNADRIDFRHEVTEEGLATALGKMNQTGLLGQLLPGQYALRGGKQGDMPGPHAYQYQFNLQIDNYAGYLCLPQDFGGRMKSTYYDSEDFNGGAMGSFMEMQNFIVPVLNHPEIDSIPEIKAMALLIYNISAQEVADIYGAFPYVDYKANKQDPPYEYNSLELIYGTIVNNIDTIVACFDHFETKPVWYKSQINNIVARNDVLSPHADSRIAGWKRFANSLKLRLATNMVKVEPTLAQKWAEEAVASGVIETPEQQFKISPMEIGFSHPLNEISNSWHDTRLNASLEVILKAYEHPILPFLFTKNSHPIIDEKDESKVCDTDSLYVGLRSGIRMLSGQSYDVNFRSAYSRLSSAILNMSLFVMKLSEVDFMRAEGALHGWNMGGTAEYFYTKGIENAYAGSDLNYLDEMTWDFILFSDDVYEPFLTEYLNIEKAKEIEYIDPANSKHNAKGLVEVGVKWNNSDSNEEKLEKIITQKYIAGFPNSFTAWTDLRRTGYPRIFPVINDDGDGSIAFKDIIRRIPFSGKDQESTRIDIETTGIEALGGDDKQGTRLWWDLDITNF